VQSSSIHRVYPLFVLSGAAGLAYQVVWSRLFQEIFGVTVYAVAAVLATFLAGLALGGVVLGRDVDRRPDPLRYFGGLEIGVGLTALAGYWLIDLLEPLHLWAANRYASESVALIFVRVGLAAVVILPPTFLMGGTLPAITRVFVGRLQLLGRSLSLLYALNTVGAVVGSLAAGFVLIRSFGMAATLWAAVALNLFVGTASLILAAALPRRGDAPEVEAPVATGAPHDRGGAALLLVMGLAGVVTLGLEVFWTRILILFIGTTTYSFVTMLSSFLLGLALGGFAVRRFIDRLANLRRAFGWIQLGIAASTLASLPLINSGAAQGWLTGWGRHWFVLIALRFGVSLSIMLVPALLIGMSFPLAVKIWTRDIRRLGTSVGQIYGANTAGNILGAALGGFVLLPVFGLQKGVVLLTTLSVVNAAWAFLSAEAARRRAGAGLRAAALGSGTVATLALLVFWQPRPFKAWDEQDADRVLFYREGVAATVKVIERAADPDQLWMTVDGIQIGQSFGGVDAKQQALAHLPFLLHADHPPQSVLSIGLGTGIVVGEVARHPSVESIDCAEISGAVIEAAGLFRRFNGDALVHPKINVIHDDGVNFLRRSAGRYDAIISDAKSRTKHAANATFFSSEYYRLCREHLSPGGLLIQWIPLNVPPSELGTILRTFRGVFRHLYVWIAAPYSCYLVGVEEPLVLDASSIRRVLSETHAANLKRYGLRDAHTLLSLLAADGNTLQTRLSAGTTVNTLDRPVLEFYSPRANAVAPPRRADQNLIDLLPVERQAFSSGHEVRHADEALLAAWDEARSLLAEAVSQLDAQASSGRERFLDLSRRAVESARGNSVVLYTAAAAYREWLFRDPDDARAHDGLGDVMQIVGQLGAAAQHYTRVVELRPEDLRARVKLATTLKRLGRVDGAEQELREALRLAPDSPVALAALADLLATTPGPQRRDPAEALRLARRACELTGYGDARSVMALATAQAAAGRFDEAVSLARDALSLASSNPSSPLADEIRRRLEAFRRREP
jgi:spermidine synthase